MSTSNDEEKGREEAPSWAVAIQEDAQAAHARAEAAYGATDLLAVRVAEAFKLTVTFSQFGKHRIGMSLLKQIASWTMDPGAFDAGDYAGDTAAAAEAANMALSKKDTKNNVRESHVKMLMKTQLQEVCPVGVQVEKGGRTLTANGNRFAAVCHGGSVDATLSKAGHPVLFVDFKKVEGVTVDPQTKNVRTVPFRVDDHLPQLITTMECGRHTTQHGIADDEPTFGLLTDGFTFVLVKMTGSTTDYSKRMTVSICVLGRQASPLKFVQWMLRTAVPGTNLSEHGGAGGAGGAGGGDGAAGGGPAGKRGSKRSGRTSVDSGSTGTAADSAATPHSTSAPPAPTRRSVGHDHGTGFALTPETLGLHTQLMESMGGNYDDRAAMVLSC